MLQAKRTSYGYSDYCQLVKEGSEALIRLSFKVACIKYASAIAILKSGKKKVLCIIIIYETLYVYNLIICPNIDLILLNEFIFFH